MIYKAVAGSVVPLHGTALIVSRRKRTDVCTAKIAVQDVKLINWLDNHTLCAAKAYVKRDLTGATV